jgi:hypothetical protein
VGVLASGRYVYLVTAVDRLHNEGKPSSSTSLYYQPPGAWGDFVQVLARACLRAKKP